MRQRLHVITHLFVICAVLIFAFSFSAIHAKAAGLSADASANRAEGECSYTVKGLDPSENDSITLKVLHKESKTVAYEKKITLTSSNCKSGTFSSSFSLADVKNEFDEYSVHFVYGDNTLSAGTCDFSIHTWKLALAVNGASDVAARSIALTSSEEAGGVVIPGKNHTVSVIAWPQGAAESTAKTLVSKSAFTEGSMTMSADVSQTGSHYGLWNTRVVLDSTGTTLVDGTYTAMPSQTSLTVKNSAILESKQSFGVTLDGLKNVYGIKKISFYVYNSKGKKVTSITGTKKKADGSKYYADITMKKLGYSLDIYTIKAYLTDNNGVKQLLDISTVADKRAQKGSLSVTKKNNATCVFKLKNAYLPGNIQKVSYVLYKVKGKKLTKLGTYTVKKTAGKSSITYKVHNDAVGKYKLKAYGYTAWGKKILLNQDTYKLSKKHLGKNGWFYEKFGGKKYKFYYVNNIKQIDLTKVLKLKKNNEAKKFTIEINRAASAVTIYMLNEETNKYDIPVKTCSVSVGADTWTKAGTSGLHEKSSYTPLGNYSICSNGQAVKYTVKPMHEPDGSVVYARWATHIVGNVYFHSIAVGSNSHYSLPSSTYNRLGSPCSAGCIRMTVVDAKWIYDYLGTGTSVKIKVGNSKKAGPLGKAPVIKTTAGINYDPTDPAVPDSRKKKDYKAKKITGYMTKSGKKVGY